MQLAHIARASGLFLVIGVAGLAGGCGEQVAPPVSKQEGSVAREEQRNTHKQLKEAKAATGKTGREDMRRGKNRGQ